MITSYISAWQAAEKYAFTQFKIESGKINPEISKMSQDSRALVNDLFSRSKTNEIKITT